MNDLNTHTHRNGLQTEVDAFVKASKRMDSTKLKIIFEIGCAGANGQDVPNPAFSRRVSSSQVGVVFMVHGESLPCRSESSSCFAFFCCFTASLFLGNIFSCFLSERNG